MSDNDQQILNTILTDQKAEIAPNISDAEFFEIFCAGQILKDYELSYEEISSGIVDGEHDGGVDSVYSFVSGALVYEDTDLSAFKKDVSIELHIIQSKTAAGYNEASLNKLISASRHLLDLNAKDDALTQYNKEVKAAFSIFRQTYRKLVSKFPTLTICFYYASKKADDHIMPSLGAKAAELRKIVVDLFPNAVVTVNFIGARQLLELAWQRPKTTYELTVSKSLVGQSGHVVLSSLSSYFNFLKGEDGRVRTDLFESNVRDFQGETGVNEEIDDTLKNENKIDFWWLNNGVTIIASRATLNGDIVTIENPQIVNGLQTSTQIFRHFAPDNADDKRQILIKIISSEDEETRDKITKATNWQNPIQPATLRATDRIQRLIEENLKGVGLYYDRRKNYYKNLGKPADRIISIPLMAQAVMSIILAKPDSARARPSSLIKEQEVYSSIFSEDYPIKLYTNSALLLRIVDIGLKELLAFDARDRANVRFYVLYWIAVTITGKLLPRPNDIATMNLTIISPELLESALRYVRETYLNLGGGDQLAKGTLLKLTLEIALRENGAS